MLDDYAGVCPNDVSRARDYIPEIENRTGKLLKPLAVRCCFRLGFPLRQIRSCLGASKPLMNVRCCSYGTALLDLMVGEPVAYATGSCELKAMGPFHHGFELPDHQGVNEHAGGGAPQMLLGKTVMETHKRSRSEDAPHPVDIHIGQRIRALRVRRGLSQTELGARIGVTFQQIQKYEKGKNRVAGSRLYEIAGALGVSIPDYFEGLPDPAQTGGQTGSLTAQSHSPVIAPDIASVRLVEAVGQLPPRLRKLSYGLIIAMAGSASCPSSTAGSPEEDIDEP